MFSGPTTSVSVTNYKRGQWVQFRNLISEIHTKIHTKILLQIKFLFKYSELSIVFMFNCQSRRRCFYCGRFRWRSQNRRRRQRSRCWEALFQTLVRRGRSLASPSWNVLLRRDPGWGQMRTGRSRWGSLRARYLCLRLGFFAGFEKEAHVCLDVLAVGKIWFQRLDRLSVSIQV